MRKVTREKGHAMSKTSHFIQQRAIVLLASVCVMSSGCGGDDGIMETLGTSGTTEPRPPSAYCANPNFDPTGGPGEYYACGGHVATDFQYHQCGIFVCPDGEDPREQVPIDGGTTGDGMIPFPPTIETESDGGEGVDVRTCCDPDIELDEEEGPDEGVTACESACAHAACLQAIARFDAMLNDPATWAACPGSTCVANVQESLTYFRTVVHDKFDICVQSVLLGLGTSFEMGSPGCKYSSESIGCLLNGALNMTCESVTIDFESNDGFCEQAPDQPPVVNTQACTIDIGGGSVRDSEDLIHADFTSGEAVVRTIECAEAPCPFVLDGFDVEIEDVEGSGVDLTDINASLYIAARGLVDDGAVEFPAGSIRVRVTGDVDDGLTVEPFDVVGVSSWAAFGTYDSGLFSLGYVIFEAGGYTFSAYIEEAECEEL